MTAIRTVTRVLPTVLGCYLFVRGVAEVFVIDVHDPATYRHDWGGPSLAGVLAVHTGPAVLVTVWVAYRATTRRRIAR